jgi:cytochrome c oxidase subunit 2
MSSEPSAAGRGDARPEPNHAVRFVVAWLVSAAIATPLTVVLLSPILPPGVGSEQSHGQVTDNEVLLAMSTPVLMLVIVYLLYAVIFFRQPRGAALEGPAIRGNARVQTTWLVLTSLLVLSLATYGSWRLFEDNGAGSGSGPNPVAKPSGTSLPVQVIGQQWAFTYRWPTYGGVETPHLVLPKDRTVELNVTSLDVIHSFWAIQLGVKADANPQVDNIAFVRPTTIKSFEIRCAELCGIWHGEMSDTGRVVSDAEFETWIREQQVRFAPATKSLPPYSKTYQPEPARRGG